MFTLTKGAYSSLPMFQILREGHMAFPPPVSGLEGHKLLSPQQKITTEEEEQETGYRRHRVR